MRYNNDEILKYKSLYDSLPYVEPWVNIPDKEIKFVTYKCLTHRDEEELDNIYRDLMYKLRTYTGLYIHSMFVDFIYAKDEKDETKTIYVLKIKDKNEIRIKDKN